MSHQVLQPRTPLDDVLTTADWRPPRPQQLPALRATVAAWLATEGEAFYHAMIIVGLQPQRPPGPPHVAARELAGQEGDRVRRGGLYWVSPAMTELAVHAGRQLPHRELYPYDLPSPSGLMVFGVPLAVYRTDAGRRAEIVAVSWGPWEGPPGCWPDGGIWLTFYSHLAHRAYSGPMRERATRLGCPPGPPLLPDNEAGWPFGELSTTDFPEDTTAAWAQTVCAAWLLMGQPLANTTTERTPAPVRHRLRRAGAPTGDVQIIHLRRRRSPAQGSAAGRPERDRQWQWWVSGHWRRYHCGPGGQRVERRYILDYLAGPDDKPVRGTERVRVWDR